MKLIIWHINRLILKRSNRDQACIVTSYYYILATVTKRSATLRTMADVRPTLLNLLLQYLVLHLPLENKFLHSFVSFIRKSSM